MSSEPFYTTQCTLILLLKLIWLDLNLCMSGIHKFKSVYTKAYTAAPPMTLDNLDALSIYHHIGPGIWLEWSYPKMSIHLKIWRCPASPLIQYSPFPFPSFHLPSPPSLLPSPSPPSFPFPGRPHSLNQLLGGLGERCKLTKWGLGRSPSRQTIVVYLGQKEQLCFVYLSL